MGGGPPSTVLSAMALPDQVAFLESILDGAGEHAIVALDLDGQILSWNQGARRIYGYEPHDLVGTASALSLHDLPDVASGRAQALLDRARETGIWTGEIEQVRRNGSRFTAAATLTLRRDQAGEAIGFTLIAQERARGVGGPAGETPQDRRLKRDFLANLSHELRTPLNGIIGFAEIMHDGVVGPLAPQHVEYLGDILTCARHLSRLINDVLDLARVDAGKMEFRPEPVEVAKLAGEVRDILRSPLGRKRLRLDIDVDPEVAHVVADPVRLKQVLYGFLSNAVKFSPESGRVAIRVLPERGERFRVSVEDSGPGIAPGELPRLFAEFGDPTPCTAASDRGTGLGLPLIKKIVEAQGGEVRVKSRPGEGSAFSAVLPRCPVRPARAP